MRGQVTVLAHAENFDENKKLSQMGWRVLERMVGTKAGGEVLGTGFWRVPRAQKSTFKCILKTNVL